MFKIVAETLLRPIILHAQLGTLLALTVHNTCLALLALHPQLCTESKQPTATIGLRNELRRITDIRVMLLSMRPRLQRTL